MQTELKTNEYLSSLADEKMDDKRLHSVREMCYDYNTNNMNFDDIYSKEDVIQSLEFVHDRFNHYNTLSKTMSININKDYFTQIGHSLDMLTVLSDYQTVDKFSVVYQIGNQVSTALDMLSMYYSILNKILLEKDYIW